MNKKNILVTGSAGFIGFNFLKYFNEIEEVGIIVGVDKISSVSIDEMPNLNNKTYHFFQVHTSNINFIYDLLKMYGIDYVVDFAASSHVDESIKNPDIFFEDNIKGKYALIKACLKYQKEVNPNFKLINISTDEVFGALNVNDEPFTEESPYNPRNPYSASKAAGDHLVNAYCKTFGLNAITTHCCNNFGPWQDTSKMIPKVITNILSDKEIPIYGKGSQIREWISVEDHNDAVWFLLNNGKLGESYNIGSGYETSNLELVDLIIRYVEGYFNINGASLKTFVTDRAAHDFRYSLNYDKIKKLGWSNKTTFFTEIERTIKWYHQKHQLEKV
jgi:dTDP-glucose 4,6-dehydratase